MLIHRHFFLSSYSSHYSYKLQYPSIKSVTFSPQSEGVWIKTSPVQSAQSKNRATIQETTQSPPASIIIPKYIYTYRYIVTWKCIQFQLMPNECYWRVRASFNKIRRRWKRKKIIDIHTCTTSLISQDNVRLDSYVIAHNIVQLVKTNQNPNGLIQKKNSKKENKNCFTWFN